MKTKNNDDSQIIRKSMKRKIIPSETKSASKTKKPEIKRHSSLVSHISTFYTNMFATWLSVSLVAIFLLIISFNIVFMIYETKPTIDRIGNPTDTNSFIKQVNAIQGARFVLLDEQNKIIASSFQEVTNVLNSRFVGFHIINKRVYLNHAKNYIVAGGQNVTLVIYYDLTLILAEIVIIGAVSILLFLISILTIYIRGNYLTRKAFGVVDELNIKASNISSQNLNLRLNVSDSTDELVEFALTFNRMMDRIENAYDKQKQFVSDASHELRTPIAVIQGYARMLERWGKDDKDILQESISAINKESKNMQDLVDKLLFIARNDKDTLVLVKNTFNMSELIQELARDTCMLETQHEIKSFVEPDVIVYGDRDRIKQALRIFVENALKYTDPRGTITLSLTVDDSCAVAVVKDTGRGIPEKDLPNIFDRFYQVDTARERDKGGHGLGLSIARIIILRHGGRIKVASKLGEGTLFSIYLPI